jgi:hypothetical protein
MGLGSFCRVLVEKKISLCGRKIERPARRDIQDLKGSQGYGSDI